MVSIGGKAAWVTKWTPDWLIDWLISLWYFINYIMYTLPILVILFISVYTSPFITYTLCFKKTRPPKLFIITLRNCFSINNNWYTQPAYDVTKLQYYKTVIYMTLSWQHWNWSALVVTFDEKLLFNNYFSIVDTFESVQTTNDKWKYRLQQLFKMLSLSLDTGLE